MNIRVLYFLNDVRTTLRVGGDYKITSIKRYLELDSTLWFRVYSDDKALFAIPGTAVYVGYR